MIIKREKIYLLGMMGSENLDLYTRNNEGSY